MEQTGEQDLEKSVKRLQENLDNIYKLYLLLLDLLVKIRDYEADLIERRKKKYFKTEEDIHPNTKFIDNALLLKLKNNIPLQESVAGRQLDKIWDNNPEILRHFVEKIKASRFYKAYMNEPTQDFASDKQFILKLYKNIIAPDEKLHQFLEDWEINWSDDVAIANTLVMKTLESIKEDDSRYKELPPLYKDDEDAVFGKELLLKSWRNKDELYEMIKSKTLNWDFDRISNVDKILMALALAEFLYFPNIPEMATINEYVEIAKEFSTPKSNSFVNGILDKLYKELKEQGRINKVYKEKKR
jgi:N utilization substance protein B